MVYVGIVPLITAWIGSAATRHDPTSHLTSILQWVSGGLMLSVGLYLLWQAHKKTSHESSCCGHHHADACVDGGGEGHNRADYKLATLVGISGGFLPCPTALAACLSGLSRGNILFSILSISLFAVGIAATLTVMALFVLYAKGRIGKFSAFKGRERSFLYLRGFAIFFVGLIYLFGPDTSPH